jgi:NAD(P)-dependent dehydrogenase (short-subunit alcohol dehydrogenase family)
MLKIAVIDGQGGGIGAYIIKALKEAFKDNVEIIALGTNAAATANMMKNKANKGASGENAMIWNCHKVDLIIGPLSILIANGMMGELTGKMSEAIGNSSARKFLLPINQEGVEIIGVVKEPLPHLVEKLILQIKEEFNV